jgi:four helix bundle protein
VVQTVAEEAAGRTIRLVTDVGPRVRSYADQVVRASGSVALNLAEGHGRLGRDKRYHYSVAYASAQEASAALRILVAAQAVDPEEAGTVMALLDRVRAMSWRLVHPR